MPCFISNCNRLAYQLHMSHKDASQELLLELLDHRLRQWNNKDVRLAVQRDQQNIKWKIKYAAKDYYRRVNKDANRELNKALMVSVMEPQPSNQSEILEALERLQELLKNKATKSWAESVLRVGQKETMVRFSQTRRQFANKLVKVCKYAAQHRQPKQPKQPNSHTKELHIISQWNDLMADPETTDDDVQDFISQHESYINEIVDSPLISYQGKVLKDFAHAGKDKYILVNLMAKHEQELDRRKIDNE